MSESQTDSIRLEQSWKAALADEFSLPYMQGLRQWLRSEYKAGKKIYPAPSAIFRALDLTPLDRVKVVILGQDPYHGPGQAHGLCFSVPNGVPFPPSLHNIFTELVSDLGVPYPTTSELTPWAEQGVLLLNATLTVEEGKAGSHQKRGWEQFTDRIIKILNQRAESLVFILWGAYAQEKGQAIDRTRHLVLEAPHPSPLSAHRGFFGSKPFSQTNTYLLSHLQAPIDWQLK